MSRKLLRIGSALLLTFLGADRLFAAGCDPAGALKSRETQNLMRQVSALRGLMNKYGCTGGQDKFVLACRDISRRLADAERSNAASGSADCSARQPSVRRPKTVRPVEEQRKRQPSSERLETMCVRLSDGYYFPSPNSGYGSAKDEPLIAAQCQFICDTTNIEVFRVNSGIGTTDEMISLKTGLKYSDMPNAGAYKSAASTTRCDMARYYKHAGNIVRNAALHAAEVKTATLATVETKLDVATIATTRLDVLIDDGNDTTSQLRGNMVQPRKVRIILPGFLPDEDTFISLNSEQ